MASHALVLGSGMAGLAAAGVLSRRFDRVTLLERDPEPSTAEARKGTPQGRHAHVLLKAGETAFDTIFPGLAAELEAGGSCRVDFGNQLLWCHHGSWRKQFASGIAPLTQSRPFLELHVRRRVAALGNVEFRYGVAAQGLDIKADRVVGVRTRATESGQEETIATDFVVDASGRGSQLPAWLAANGYPTPREDKLAIHLSYASRTFKVPKGEARPWTMLIVYQTPPAEKRVGLVFPCEGGEHWIVTLGAYGEAPPADEAAFLAHAASLCQPDLHEAIVNAEPVSDIQRIGVPHARWVRYERLRRFPRGLVPIGDSICCFDPVFGQGMTVASQGALRLAAWLDRGGLERSPRPYLRQVAQYASVPWLLSGSEDLRYPETAGPRPFWLGILQAYTRRLFVLAGQHAGEHDRLLRVFHLLSPPALLFHPVSFLRVLGLVARGS